MAGLTDVQRLGRRVSWLDRYRRGVALLGALAIAVLVAIELSDGLGPAWSRYHAGALGALLGFFTWIILEVSLAWLTAFWETEAARLLHGPQLPRAILRRNRKRGPLGPRGTARAVD
jgi:hypothetical protein